jgi:hypothetical protein
MTDTNHTQQLITEKLIMLAAQLGACPDGLAAARARIGRRIADLPSRYSDWAARLFDGRSILSDGTEVWHRDGRLHREDGPAVIARAIRRKTSCRWIDAVRTHIGKFIGALCPAQANWATRLFDRRSTLSDSTEEWYREGERHREDGPALIRADGGQEWYLNGKLHRENGPAVIAADGSEEWFREGLRHRNDGPAVVRCDGSVEWWTHGYPKRTEEPTRV